MGVDDTSPAAEGSNISGWTDEDDYALWLSTLGPTEPLFTAQLFIVRTLAGDPTAADLVTPESRAAWGDFSGVRDDLADLAWGSYAHPADGAPDVCYVALYANQPDFHVVRDADTNPTQAVAALTLVWRPEAGRWLIHAIGNILLEPADCPARHPASHPNTHGHLRCREPQGTAPSRTAI